MRTLQKATAFVEELLMQACSTYGLEYQIPAWLLPRQYGPMMSYHVDKYLKHIHITITNHLLCSRMRSVSDAVSDPHALSPSSTYYLSQYIERPTDNLPKQAHGAMELMVAQAYYRPSSHGFCREAASSVYHASLVLGCTTLGRLVAPTKSLMQLGINV